MKPFILFAFCLCLFSIRSSAQTAVANDTMHIVEAACGECRFHMKGKGCHLAVRIDGKPYLVEGTDIDDHGDAHSKEGFCNAIRKAQVSGKIVHDNYVATSFRLLPAAGVKP